MSALTSDRIQLINIIMNNNMNHTNIRVQISVLSKEPISLFLCNHSLTVHMHLAKAGAVSRCLSVAEQDTDKAAFPGFL